MVNLRGSTAAGWQTARASARNQLGWRAACLLLLTALSLSAAQPEQEPQPDGLLIVFGDSLSDTGNWLALSNFTQPDPRFYRQGRFTDEHNWVDYFDSSVDAVSAGGSNYSVLNYAVGGSAACGPATLYIGPPPLAAQARLYTAGILPPKDSNATDRLDLGTAPIPADIFLITGGNDYINAALRAFKDVGNGTSYEEAWEEFSEDLNILPEKVISCVLRVVDALSKRPAYAGSDSMPPHFLRRIFIASVPALDATPLPKLGLGLDVDGLSAVAAAQQRHLMLLRDGLELLSSKQQAGNPTPFLVPLAELTEEVFNSPFRLGITETIKPCILWTAEHHQDSSVQSMGFTVQQPDHEESPASVCADAGQHFFYDQVHPTSAVHANLAQRVRALLEGVL